LQPAAPSRGGLLHVRVGQESGCRLVESARACRWPRPYRASAVGRPQPRPRV